MQEYFNLCQHLESLSSKRITLGLLSVPPAKPSLGEVDCYPCSRDVAETKTDQRLPDRNLFGSLMSRRLCGVSEAAGEGRGLSPISPVMAGFLSHWNVFLL